MTKRDECQHGSLRRSCELCERDEVIAGLRRRLEQMIGAHSDDWRYWDSAARQALRWLDAGRSAVAKTTEVECSDMTDDEMVVDAAKSLGLWP